MFTHHQIRFSTTSFALSLALVLLMIDLNTVQAQGIDMVFLPQGPRSGMGIEAEAGMVYTESMENIIEGASKKTLNISEGKAEGVSPTASVNLYLPLAGTFDLQLGAGFEHRSMTSRPESVDGKVTTDSISDQAVRGTLKIRMGVDYVTSRVFLRYNVARNYIAFVAGPVAQIRVSPVEYTLLYDAADGTAPAPIQQRGQKGVQPEQFLSDDNDGPVIRWGFEWGVEGRIPLTADLSLTPKAHVQTMFGAAPGKPAGYSLRVNETENRSIEHASKYNYTYSVYASIGIRYQF